MDVKMTDKTNDEDFDIAGEMVALAIKAGRRASYDLKHACGYIKDPEIEKMFLERAELWLSIFQFDSGLKDYRHSLHREIDKLEWEVERLKGKLREHGIDDNEFEDRLGVPF